MRFETGSPKILDSGHALIIPVLRVLALTKRHVGSRNEIKLLASRFSPWYMVASALPSRVAKLSRALPQKEKRKDGTAVRWL